MEDSLFLLLLMFVVESRQGKGGCVNIHRLKSECIITDDLKYQVYSRLRTELKGSLLEKNGEKFIQSDGLKNYRISAHPDFITYDKEKLLNHQDNQIKELAKDWFDKIGDPTIADAICARIIHSVIKINLEGDFMRKIYAKDSG